MIFKKIMAITVSVFCIVAIRFSVLNQQIKALQGNIINSYITVLLDKDKNNESKSNAKAERQFKKFNKRCK